MTKTTFYLVRHGEVDNPKKIIYERLPGFHLSEKGKEQVKATADFLTQYGGKINQIYASPLERTRETAEIINQNYNLDLQLDERIIESENYFAMEKKGPLMLLKNDNWSKLLNPIKPSWGEPYKEIKNRMIDFIKDVGNQNKKNEQKVIVVSHENPIWITRRYFEGKTLFHNPSKREVELASITEMVYDSEADDILQIKHYNPADQVK